MRTESVICVTDLTIEETKGQEECSRDNDRQVFDVDHLDCDESGRREHHCCDSKADRVLSAGDTKTRRSCENPPVGIGEVSGVLECRDEDNDRDHHWKARHDKGQD